MSKLLSLVAACIALFCVVVCAAFIVDGVLAWLLTLAFPQLGFWQAFTGVFVATAIVNSGRSVR